MRHFATAPSSLAPSVYPVAGVGASALLVVSRANNASDLWSSDGTASGTNRLRAFGGGRASAPYGVRHVGGRLVFTACNDLGCEPWITDGTADGTRQLTDVIRGSASSYPDDYAMLGGRLLFRADRGGDEELWAIDLAPPAQATATTTAWSASLTSRWASGSRWARDCSRRALPWMAMGTVAAALPS